MFIIAVQNNYMDDARTIHCIKQMEREKVQGTVTNLPFHLGRFLAISQE